MYSIRRTLPAALRLQHPTRSLSTTRALLADPPPGNQSPSAKQHGRTSQPVDDPQSSAASRDPNYTQTEGDDNPMKQPDRQVPSERSTGFHEVDEVKGGKEGLGARSDKPS
ncbi:hypothetical protein BAUCODRAFT_422649 [Baudoinia panamericana UAMH 10762]|uniref:Uncharacterized protein n=1 Tax=Baudoinia panamericana (strain UAMH 10762) TaxID=717646 RepID=M2MNT1_BAUPA|nr:uncharacterized protein BAUCODRAFT_422649 [Baudoinia panamericana UAMH 10762]EMC98351.1 hypothetical protein BAUCODRAFT_422649 [Baudoinia panamericana UAMH 10762]